MFGALVVIAGILGVVVHQATNVAPSCYDHKQNEGETGIDCGGPCTFYCANELSDPTVEWVRTFQIRPGVVDAVAYIEHTYPTAAARTLRYEFKLYDDKDTLIADRTGATFLGPMGTTAIVETLIQTGSAMPARTTFTIVPPIPWEKIPASYSQVVIKTDRKSLESYADGTRLTATLDNTSRVSFKDLDVVAILYDKDGNAVTASKAYLPSLAALATQTVVFTWPFQMPTPITQIEVIPRFNPFSSVQL